MLISCLMPTFNRYPQLAYLVEEAVECFLRQDDPDRELVICNDTPGQRLIVDDERVKVLNLDCRMATLSDKIQMCIDVAQGDLLCRWDDDDISLPHRLSYSRRKLADGWEWRAENYLFDTGTLAPVAGPANTHIQALWRRDVLNLMGGQYPPNLSGYEDIAFNRELVQAGLPAQGELIPVEEVYYLYRWSTGSRHLSGVGGGPEKLQEQWDRLGQASIAAGDFHVRPRWHRNHVARAKQTLSLPHDPQSWESIPGWCDFGSLYDAAVAACPRGGKLVEVGCYHGRSLAYLGQAAKKAGKRLQVIGIDLGIGTTDRPSSLFGDVPTLLANLQRAGVSDVVQVVAGESTEAAAMFADRSLDFVFIDGSHEYQDILADLQAWHPKVKEGGVIAGHDYQGTGCPDVMRAVDQHFRAPRPHAFQSNAVPTCWEVTL